MRKFATAQAGKHAGDSARRWYSAGELALIGVRSLSNRYLASELDQVRRRVQEGQSFGGALLARGVFSGVAVKMVEVGESTGALQEMLNSLADFYDEEIETEVARFITLIEPVLLVIMGIVIAMVVLALYMPLFEQLAHGV